MAVDPAVEQMRIPRPVLTARLRRALDAGSVVLVADAGFGKTVAVEQALHERGGAAVWLRATPADREPGRLLARLADALRREVPGLADVSAERLASAIDPVDVSGVAEDLVADVERLTVEPLVVVLDDSEHLAGAPSAAIVASLLAADPAALRVAVLSRRQLGLRTARLRAAGRLTELGSGDLAYSAAECEAHLRLVTGREPDDEAVDRLLAATEGWPLAVALAAVSGHSGDAFAAASSRDGVFEYLAEEVLEDLPSERRAALLDASVVDELDPQVEHALGLPDGFGRELARSGLFVRPLGDGRYAFHPLFRDLLRARLEQEATEEHRRDLHARAAAALAGAGRGVEALGHWLDAAAWDEAADALATQGPTLASTVPDTVTAWLERLPASARERPALLMLAGRLEVGAGHLDAALQHCRAAVEGFEREGAPAPALWLARLMLGDVCMASGAVEAGLEASKGGLDADDGGLPALACALTETMGLARLCRFDEARAVLDRIYAHPLTQPYTEQRRGTVAVFFDLPALHLDDALANSNATLRVLEGNDFFNRIPYANYYRGVIHEQRGEPELALAAFHESLESARRRGVAGWVGARARLTAAVVLAQLGHDAEAQLMLDGVDPDWRWWSVYDGHTARAIMAARAGDRAAALAAVDRALDEVRRFPVPEPLRAVALVAPVLAELGATERAIAEVERELVDVPAGVSGARARTVLAWLRHGAGDEAGAHAALAEAFAEAGDQIRYHLRCEWPRVEPVVWSALEAGALDARAAVQALDAALPGGAAAVTLTRHPRTEVRRAALELAPLGPPEAIERLRELTDDPDPGVAAAAQATWERLARRPPAVAIGVLGRFSVRRGAWTVEESAWDRKVAQRLLRLLLVRRGDPVPEDDLLEALWSGKPADSARRGLQTAVSAIRGVLDVPGAPSRIEVSERTYALRLREGDTVDADAFERAAELALAAGGADRLPALRAAAERWSGEPLPEERYSDWAASWRERLTDRYADVLAALAEAHEAAGDRAAGARVARALVDLDPLDENAHRLLMRSYARAGRRGHALRQFLECRRVLVDELGVEPSAETVAYQRRILEGEPL